MTQAPAMGAQASGALVLDTNIVLDLLVFADAAAQELLAPLQSGSVRWLATAPMRGELARVLDYAQIVPRLRYYGYSATQVLARYDALAQPVPVAPRAAVRCTDPDDQMFIDLAVAHRALLLSKDRAVLCMARRLQALGAQTRSQWGGAAAQATSDRASSPSI